VDSGVTEFKMKKTLYILSLLSVVPFVGLWPATVSMAGPPRLSGGEGALSLQVENSKPPTKGTSFVQNYLPILDGGFDDLDARDAQNRPIHDSAAQADLTQLFVQNLYALATVEAPHSMHEAWALLESLSALFHKAILTCIQRLSGVVQAALRPGFRRFVHNVDKLWITFSVGVSLASPRFSNPLFENALLHLNLRC
jgi:hypothetical protein